DWRNAGLPARSAEFCRPLYAARGGGERAGGLPRFGSLLEVEPAGAVQLAALKAAGNPLASGSGHRADLAEGIAVRLTEALGAQSTAVVIRCGLRNVVGHIGGPATSRADLLERARLHSLAADGLRLHGFEIATVLTRLNLPKVLDADHAALAPNAEAAQPLYARYWLHNRGPAALGGLPASAHLHPQHPTAEPGSVVLLRLTASSDCTDAALHGRVRLVCPDGWTASPDGLPFVLPPGEYLETDIELTVPAGLSPGLYPVRGELVVTGSDAASIPAAWRQLVEDICVVSVGAPPEHELLRLISGPEAVDVGPGETARLAVTVGTDARADLSVEAQLISPWGTWEWIGPAAVGATLPAAGHVQLEFDVSPPAWVDPGEWWALVRVACAGRLVYSPAVRVAVR
ncbi:MAG: alpha-mannosidase, partial [Mycobacteriaceae bacterium]|nr:alpha-mannosidase [Mycobacteriaceae bacterium]